jgi:hypothetical protein
MSNTVDKHASLHRFDGQTVERVAADTTVLDLGGRERGAWHGDGQAIAPPRPVSEDAPMTDRQAAAAWGHELPDAEQDRTPNERALDLVIAAGTGGYVLAVMQAGVAGAPTGAYHIALVDTSGLVSPELLKNEQGHALTYASAEAASTDRERLIELAAERQLEHALEDEHDIEHGVSR